MDDSVEIVRRRYLTTYLAIAGTVLAMSSAHADDLSTGQTIAMQGTAKGVAACISCHGAKGEGNAAAGFPRLAGVSASYLSAQLTAFADGTRQNPIMQPMAKLLSAHERDAVAQYFAGLQPPPGIKASDNESAKPSDVGAWIATRGRWNEGLPACVQCHGPGGIGVGATFPPLAGQPASYIASQLHSWKSGTRPPGPMALMAAVAGKLSDTDITAVAAYYGGTGASADESSANGSKQ
ncbi:c-type cytochrome [Paraburkholderia sediminicola]|uniref:c-type cytochrome n=1 Tax=Paraburkholderia sediminicola TaxID=458836 RepID=UPI0038BDDA30